MRRLFLLLATAAVTVGAAPPPRSAGPEATVAPSPRPARLPRFAEVLADRAPIDGPGAWRVVSEEAAWERIAGARPADRQGARWSYALSLLGKGRAPEALAVIEVMGADDPDLALVPDWQLARGAALAGSGRGAQAAEALGAPGLAGNPEACAWRMLALAGAGLHAPALGQVDCALPAINARAARDRGRFVLAASGAALGAGRPEQALRWLGALPDRDPAANLLHGKALAALGKWRPAGLRFRRVALGGTPEQRADAEMSLLEAGVSGRTVAPAEALTRIDRLRFAWRGDAIEERALRLGWKLAEDTHDTARALALGSTLFRHFDLGPNGSAVLTALRAHLAAALAPQSTLPLGQAAGLFWDHRDLAPAGGEGDLLAMRLADRLAGAGLYARAAELLGYQLSARAQDIAQGPLSVRVATLHILAGQPARALASLRASDLVPYPAEMLWDRRRVGAVALHLLGRRAEAHAVLADVPGGDRIRAEMYWKAGDWESLAAVGGSDLPAPSRLSEVAQAAVLRQAIALAMLGREDALARLRARYGGAFAGLPAARAFDTITRPVGTLDPAAVSDAMSALPAASPAGAMGDLLDAAVKAKG